MEVDPRDLPGREPYFLLTSLVVPRPIAWVSSVSPTGVLNVAPHSYFNAVSSNPLIVHFTSTGVKDTLTNVRAAGEFVVNIVSLDIVEKMNQTAANYPPEEDEFAHAGLTAAPSKTVAVPRVAEAKAVFECGVVDIRAYGNGNIVFGEVQLVYVDDAVMENGRVVAERLQPVARLGGSEYTGLGKVFKLARPVWDPEKKRAEPPG